MGNFMSNTHPKQQLFFILLYENRSQQFQSDVLKICFFLI